MLVECYYFYQLNYLICVLSGFIRLKKSDFIKITYFFYEKKS